MQYGTPIFAGFAYGAGDIGSSTGSATITLGDIEVGDDLDVVTVTTNPPLAGTVTVTVVDVSTAGDDIDQVSAQVSVATSGAVTITLGDIEVGDDSDQWQVSALALAFTVSPTSLVSTARTLVALATGQGAAGVWFKDPDAVLDYGCDWSNVLGDLNDAIISFSVIVPAESGLKSLVQWEVQNRLITAVLLSEGVIGNWPITFRVVTQEHRRDDRTHTITVTQT